MYGTLIKYSTGEAIGPASPREWLACAEAMLRSAGHDPDGIWEAQPGTWACVRGGLNRHVTRADIRLLLEHADRGGDVTLAARCAQALLGDGEARTECGLEVLHRRCGLPRGAGEEKEEGSHDSTDSVEGHPGVRAGPRAG